VPLPPLPVGELLLGFFLVHAIDLLDFSGQALAIASNLHKLIIGKLAPLLFDVALELFPITFNPIPVHFYSFYSAFI